MSYSIEDLKRLVKKEELSSNPKILIFDVETAPLAAYVWKRWKENVSLDQTISEWFMICWSAKWYGDNHTYGEVLTPEEAVLQDDARICKSLWKLIDEADYVVAYNGKRADIPWINTRFIINNMVPPTPYIVIDPCEIARKKFGFSSNKLDALAGYFGIEHKMDTDFNLWKRCMQGDREALDYMLAYNIKDSIILEKVFDKMRPWMNQYNIIGFSDGCTACGSKRIEKIEGKYFFTSSGAKYELFRCKDCQTVFRGKINLNKNKKQYINCSH